MNNTPKRHLWPLWKGHHKCRVQMTFLVYVSVILFGFAGRFSFSFLMASGTCLFSFFFFNDVEDMSVFLVLFYGALLIKALNVFWVYYAWFLLFIICILFCYMYTRVDKCRAPLVGSRISVNTAIWTDSKKNPSYPWVQINEVVVKVIKKKRKKEREKKKKCRQKKVMAG